DLGVGINSNAQLASDNDRVFDDLWRKDNMPTVLNNPYSECDKVEHSKSFTTRSLVS
ncbi:nitric oxide synthase, brain isoform X1, partial [Tachysurus ichikawai]